MMPGRMLHRLAARVCSAKTLERVVEPAIADLQKEYAAAESGSAVRRARILFASYLAILEVTLTCALERPAATDDEWRAIVRIVAWSVGLTAVITGLLMLPPLSIVEARASSVFLAGLISQAVPLAIPMGLTLGIALGMAGRAATRGVTRVILLSAVLASLFSFVTLAWVMPAGNQAFRQSVAQAAGITGQLIKGPSEMTFSELDREAAIAAAAGNVTQASRYAWSFHLRFALSVASIVLAGFLLATSVRRTVMRVFTALLACFAYWALIFVGQELAVFSPVAPVYAGTTPAVVLGAWLPNIVLAAAMLLGSSRSSRLRGSGLRGSVVESPHRD
jgi:Lipopolysaccharide export system permease LptF/LptG